MTTSGRDNVDDDDYSWFASMSVCLVTAILMAVVIFGTAAMVSLMQEENDRVRDAGISFQQECLEEAPIEILEEPYETCWPEG